MKLENLISVLCPSGVAYSPLGALCKIETGKLNANAMNENGIYPFFTCDAKPFRINTYAFDTEAIIISGNGSQVGHINYYNGKFNAYQRTYVLSNFSGVSVSFLLHYLRGYLREHIYVNSRKGSVPYITLPMLQEFRIPLPPLAVQQEIVRILDSFTELTTELNKKLTAELTARRKQYEHYRDELMNTAKDLQERSFSELFDFQNGFAFKSSSFKESGSPILRITNIQEQHINTSGLVYFSSEDYRENLAPFIVYPGDIVVAMSGATTGKIGVNDTNLSFYLNQRVGKFIPRENVILKQYLYHLLLKYSGKLLEISSGSGAQPNLSSEKLKRLTAQVPSIPEQTRILNLLERFDVLNTSLGSGLPAEITARQKQYEYYRDKLLTFKELER